MLKMTSRKLSNSTMYFMFVLLLSKIILKWSLKVINLYYLRVICL
jgi:hypothetical protein